MVEVCELIPRSTYYTVVQAGQISFRASIDTGSSDCSSKFSMGSTFAKMGSFDSLVGLDGLQYKNMFSGSKIPIDVCIADVCFDQ